MQSGDESNLGTGSVLSSYLQLPGGWFNAYSGLRAPQGMRSITKKCLLFGTSEDDLYNQVVALRAKLGIEGKLTIEWGNNALWWQWATMQDCDTGVPFEFRGVPVLPCSLNFTSADQHWNKVITSPSEWAWGDNTWTFGDGTSEYGETGTQQTLTANGGGSQNFTITHNGNIDATNVAITIIPGTSAITLFNYVNNTRHERSGFSATLSVGHKAVINSGSRSVWHYRTQQTATSFDNSDGVNTYVSLTSHGYSTGQDLFVDGTGVWDGIYRSISVSSVNLFTFPSTKYGIYYGGTVRRLESIFDSFKSTYTSVWPVLSPGDNSITVYVGGNGTQDATIAWEFYEHYA